MENFYITSDLHFFHKNIIKYCNRPYELYPNDGEKTKSSILKMNEDILAEFDKLPPNSTVINLGDLMLARGKTFEEAKSLVDRMKANNKSLWIVLGNHDRDLHKLLKNQSYENAVDLFDAIGFDRVYDNPFKMDDIYFTHEPFYSLGLKIAYGHTHDKDVDANYFNHSCDNWAMVQRVLEADNIKAEVDTSENLSGLEVNPKHYFNVCWDKHHRILNFNEVLNYFSRF